MGGEIAVWYFGGKRIFSTKTVYRGNKYSLKMKADDI